MRIPTTLTDTELLQTIDEERLSDSESPQDTRKPLTEAELLETIEDEGLSGKPVRDFTNTELLQTIDEEGLSPTGVPSHLHHAQSLVNRLLRQNFYRLLTRKVIPVRR